MEPDFLVIYDDIRLTFYWWHFGVDPDPEWDRGVDPDPEWDRDPDADPDPAIFIIDLQDANQKTNLKKSFSANYFLKEH